MKDKNVNGLEKVGKVKYSRQEKRLMQFLQDYILIEGVLVQKELFNYSFKCKYPGCGVCCYAGTCVTKEETQRVGDVIEEIKKYLSPSKVQRLNKLKNKFYRKNYLIGYWRLRTWEGFCLFLMEDGGCAVHKFCMDTGRNWIQFHFNLCVTYPLRIDVKERLIQIEEELFEQKYSVPCFGLTVDGDTGHHNEPVIYSMKAVITERLGEEFWKALEKKYVELKNKKMEKV